MKPIIGFDTETFPISQQAQHPRLVCLSLATPTETDLIGNDDWAALRETLAGILTDDTSLYVGQNLGYDLGVIAANFPELLPYIFDALNAERFSDTMIREKLLTLSSTGDLKFLQMPDGSKKALKWDMATLVDYYFHTDISGDKSDPCSWRLNFNTLDGLPASQYPQGARDYAIGDSTWLVGKVVLEGLTLNWPEGGTVDVIEPGTERTVPGIWQMQEDRRNELIATRGIDPFKQESFRVLVDFCLKLMSGTGAATDPVQVARVEAMLAEELKPEKLNLLLEQGILRPATPPQPHKNGAQEHVTGCHNLPKKTKEPCQCPAKMTAGQKETVDTEKLKAYVLAFAKARNTDTCPVCLGEGSVKSSVGENIYNGCKDCGASGRVPKPTGEEVKLRYTAPTENFPAGQLQTDAEFMDDYGHMDPVLGQYKHRQDLQKLVTTEIPRMKMTDATGARVVAPLVYPQYDGLKETGRTSSFSSKRPEWASFNVQNVDPRVRGCFVPSPGHLLFSVDYSGMELGTLAQTCYDLFGYSVMRDQINAGVDVHAYTGAQLAYSMDEEFRKLCISHGASTAAQIFNVFREMKGCDEGMPDGTSMGAFYKHWRKFAKPVNLGYPGGLGPPTFVKLAKVAYDVIVDTDTAKLFRDLWKQTYPEMVEYFNYINTQCIDPWNKGWDEDEKKEYDKYHYDSPLGLHRAGCDYCACANGLGLQTRSADGALAALTTIIPACYLGRGSAILGPVDGIRVVKPWGFIHDEIVGEIRDDEFAHDRLEEIKRLMVEAMRIVTPDVLPSANACLMRRWDKNAEPVYDKNGRLTVWEPKAP